MEHFIRLPDKRIIKFLRVGTFFALAQNQNNVIEVTRYYWNNNWCRSIIMIRKYTL
jgi:hypothetical protein